MNKIIWIVFALLLGQISTVAQDISQLRKQKPFSWTGSIQSGMDWYEAKGIPPRGSNFAWGIRGNANAAVYGVNLPFSFAIGRQRPEYFAPTFARIGVSPTYKWFKLHAGHRNLHFSDYTLAGHTFLGGGIELTPRKFRFAAMYGRFQKPVVEDTSITAFNLPAYRRMGYGLKIGIGSDRTYFDLIAFHAADDTTTSVPKVAQFNPPKSNTVFGMQSQIQLGRFISWRGNAGLSILTRNLLSEAIVLPIDTLPQWAETLIEKSKFSTTTRVNIAAKTGLTVQLKTMQLRAEYERIDPEYESLGAYFFQNDMENYTLGMSGTFAKGKVSVNGNGGIQRNNLLGNRSETTRRWVGNGTIAVNPSPKWGCMLNYNNFAVNQSAGRIALSDTVRLRQINQTFVLVPRFTIIKDTTSVQNLTLTANYQNLNDLNPLTRQYANMDVYVAQFNYAYNYMPKQWTINAGLNINRVKTAIVDNRQSGFTLGCNKAFQAGKLSTGLSGTHNFSRLAGKRDGSITSAQFNLSWSPHSKHTLSTYASLLRTRSIAYDDYTEWRMGVQWAIRLR